MAFSPDKVAAAFVDNEGLVSSVQGEKGNISRGGAGDREVTSSGEINPRESEDSKFSSSTGSSHISSC